MSSVGEWLESIGLSQYAELFEAERIEFDVVAQLTDEDLREIGIPSAIASGCSQRSRRSMTRPTGRNRRRRDRPPSAGR
jgi:hypothetical protein